jgi:Asp-tRNA(Asn)/Glu-tRNA(Gln) amidotransferase A subunit family amidase
MKPSFGAISRTGVLTQAPALDQIGGFARSLEDLALLMDAMFGHDPADLATRPEPAPRLSEQLAAAPRLKPRLAFVETARWPEAEEDTKAAFAELIEALGDAVQPVQLPSRFDQGWEMHRRIMLSELAHSLAPAYARGRPAEGEKLLSDRLAQMIEEGRQVSAVAYHEARAAQRALQAELDQLFAVYDAVLTPAAPGQAPRGMATGSPVFCSLWTLTGVPAISLPILSGTEGLPIGLQMVGGFGEDGRLLATARWVLEALAPPARAGGKAPAKAARPRRRS